MFALMVALAAAACGGGTKKQTTPVVTDDPGGDEGPARDETPTTAEVTPVDPADPAVPRFGPIYFDFDTATLSDEARDTLQALATWMDKNPGATVTIAGHADERGTPEYNIGLGEERAKAAKQYLVKLGVPATRIQTLSYGEERPAVSGADESSWAKNRRDELEVTGAGPRAGR